VLGGWAGVLHIRAVVLFVRMGIGVGWGGFECSIQGQWLLSCMVLCFGLHIESLSTVFGTGLR
jgi:hypothetical protein